MVRAECVSKGLVFSFRVRAEVLRLYVDALWPSGTVPTAARTSSQVTFPIDFFEHNQQLTDVEFGGNDLLQVYNAQQIKHRLNSTGMYVANTKVSSWVWGWLTVWGALVSSVEHMVPVSSVGGLNPGPCTCKATIPNIERSGWLHIFL